MTEREEENSNRRHESLDHKHPTDAGLMEPEGEQHPATGVMGDETLIRDVEGGIPSYPGIDDAHRGKVAHPGPTEAPLDPR